MKMIYPNRKIPPLFERFRRALIAAGRDAHRIAHIYGTPVYVYKNGKVVALKPWLDAKRPCKLKAGKRGSKSKCTADRPASSLKPNSSG